jgi:hypothetical protein
MAVGTRASSPPSSVVAGEFVPLGRTDWTDRAEGDEPEHQEDAHPVHSLVDREVAGRPMTGVRSDRLPGRPAPGPPTRGPQGPPKALADIVSEGPELPALVSQPGSDRSRSAGLPAAQGRVPLPSGPPEL